MAALLKKSQECHQLPCEMMTSLYMDNIFGRLTGENLASKQACVPNWFIRSAALILLITGAAKVWAAFGNAKLLGIADPIGGLKFGQLILAVGVVEIIIALLCFISWRPALSLGLVAWLSTNFMFYRISLQWVGWHKPCNCLGNLTDGLHISPQTADMAMKIVLAYLLLGSYASLFWLWRQKRRAIRMLDANSNA
jgi:hypothetical protein